MDGPESFIKALKRIGFPDVHKYKPEEFTAMFADKDLSPILQCVCDLNEDNVLSPEELAEFSSIPPDELTRLEKLAQKTEAFQTDTTEDEKKEEIQFLERRLSHIEEHNKILQKQKELMKSHIGSLLEEKDKCDKVLVDAKRKFETYKMQKLPQAQTELVSVLQSISKLIQELQKLLTEDDRETPSMNLKGVESYFEEEEQLLNYVQNLLSKDFEVEDFKNFTLNVPGHQESKLLKEVNFLQKVLKSSKMEELKAVSEKEKMSKIVDFYKKCEGILPRNISEISTSELWTMLGEESDCSEKLIAKEKLINLYLSAAVADRVDAQCNKVGALHVDEVIQAYNSNLEKIQGPLEKVLSHRSRLELVILYLDAYAKKFKNIKQLTEESSNFLEEEKEVLHNRKCHFENELQKEIPKKDKYLSEDSVFLSIFKILRSFDDNQNLSSVCMDDVLKKVEKMYKEKEFLEKLQEKKLSVLNSLENQRSAIEKLVFQGKEFADLSEMDSNFNTKLNKMGVTYTTVRKAVLDVHNYLETKEKLIQKDRKLRLARYLYIYALCDEEKFKLYIDKIKTSAENCMRSAPDQS